MRKKIYVIAGATATGKSAVAEKLAEKIGGELISADSMQVYRGMDIGTAKNVQHQLVVNSAQLIDVVNPDEEFSAALFQRMAAAAVEDICSRGKVPILVGGTGFYINALLYGTEFSDGDNLRENQLREQLAALAREKGADFLHKKLAEADPVYADSVHANNVKRVARALAFCETTGGLFSSHNAAQKQKRKMLYDAVFCVLSLPREVLYERINARTVEMFEAGLVSEVQGLLAKGYHKGLAAMQGIGYKEVVQFIEGELSQTEAIAAVQQATRNYAKRQETWLKNQTKDTFTLNAQGKTPEELANEIMQLKL